VVPDPGAVLYWTSMARLEPLDRDECLALLARGEIGHLAVGGNLHPTIFPVNYVLDDETIVVRTDSETLLARAHQHPVAFLVDEIDVEHHTGWSVHLWGRTSEVTDRDSAALREHVHGLALNPWVEGPRAHWVRIIPTQITGRRLV
jgi:nitroimidazol reductase NimA-like FMN-containing flavoprotein (pyridoxamine 5'-phosphate oxidase superfamily)